MSEKFSFDFNIDEKSMEKLRESLGFEKLEEIHNRFKNGTETEDDLINHYESYKIKCVLPDEPKKETELNVVETKYYKKVIDLYQNEKAKNKTLEELLQGKLFELYKYYKDLTGTYQANCISKDNIRELLEKYDKDIAWDSADDHYYFTKFIQELLGRK